MGTSAGGRVDGSLASAEIKAKPNSHRHHSHAIRYQAGHAVYSLVAVEEVAVNPRRTIPHCSRSHHLPEGWQMEKVFGAPATGTADAFLEATGITMLVAGLAMWWLMRRSRRGAW